ncbi:hypothetical protein Tco_0689835 [Tanacetum coccineum]
MVIGIESFSTELITSPILSKKEVGEWLTQFENMSRYQLCSSCEMSKAKRSSFKTKAVPSIQRKTKILLHMDLCGPKIEFASINWKTYIDALNPIFKPQLFTVRTTEARILEQARHAYIKEEGSEHQTFYSRTPEQNGAGRKTEPYSGLGLLERCFSASKLFIIILAESSCNTAILRTDQSSYPLMKRLHITS